MWPCLYPSSWGLRESHGESCNPQRGRLQMCGVYHTKSHRTSGHSPNPPLLPPPTASILPRPPLTSSAATPEPPHRLPPVAAAFATVLPPLPPSPLALVLPCTTTSPRRRLPNGAISVAFREWTRCRVTRSIFRILAMEALSKAAALSITMARRCLYPRLPFPAGILRIPVFSVPVARNQDSCSAVAFFYPLRNPVCTGPTYVAVGSYVGIEKEQS